MIFANATKRKRGLGDLNLHHVHAHLYKAPPGLSPYQRCICVDATLCSRYWKRSKGNARVSPSWIQRGEIVGIYVTAGNVNAHRALPGLVCACFGELFVNKGYLSKQRVAKLKSCGIGSAFTNHTLDSVTFNNPRLFRTDVIFAQ